MAQNQMILGPTRVRAPSLSIPFVSGRRPCSPRNRRFTRSCPVCPHGVQDEFDPIRILSVDDHPLLREGIASLLANQKDMKLVAQASTGMEAILQFRSQRPEVTLMDLQMPEMSGIDAIIAIRSEFRNASIIVLTTYGGDALAQRALKAGAKAYILKNHVRKDLLDTIRAVHAGTKRIHPDVAAEIAAHAADDELSAREIEVLSLVSDGKSNKLIADQLSITEETVKGHMKSILSKLGAKDRTHAVTLGLRRGIIQL